MLRTFFFAFLLGAVLLPGTSAQNDTSKIQIGTVDIHADNTVLTRAFTHLMGHAKITSDNYDFYAADIKVYSVPASKAGPSGVQRAVAEGGAVPGSQVVAHTRQPLQGTAYEIYSDRAVYTPDKSRPSGGVIKFTGHVKVITKSGFLAGPSVSTFEYATVVLGAGPEYPQVETGTAHIILTPAQ